MALQDLTPQLRTRLGRMERAVGIFVGLATLLLLSGFLYYLYHTAVRKGWFLKKIPRSEEHTSELQSPCNLVCRLLLEKKKSYNARALSTASARPSSPLLLPCLSTTYSLSRSALLRSCSLTTYC